MSSGNLGLASVAAARHRARDFVRGKVGERVRIANVKHGKYAGRVVADMLVGGERLSDMLIAERLGRPYEGAWL